MITVMELEAALKKARKSGLIKGSDVLIAAPRTGNLIIQRNRAYFGDIDMNTGVVSDWAENPVIKGAHVTFIVLDEISAFLEVEVDGSGYAHGGVEPCGAYGGCPLPKGHNMGRADVPENHRAPALPQPGPAQDSQLVEEEEIRKAASAPFTVPSGQGRHDTCRWIESERRYECEEKR